MEIIYDIRETIYDSNPRSAWDKGVKEYALELVDKLIEEAEYNGLQAAGYEFYGSPADYKALLNGASDWSEYSWGGCSLIYDKDIAERLCNASELKLTRHGERRPNSEEQWLDTQARALVQAARMICGMAKGSEVFYM